MPRPPAGRRARARRHVRPAALRTAASGAVAALALALVLPGAAQASGSAASTVGGEALAGPGVVVDLPAGVVPPADNEAASYVLADLTSGEVLAAKGAHERLPPASTLKVLTALTLLPVLDKEQVVVGADDAAMVEGSKVGIEAGLSYSIDLLFKAMLLQSGNDAAHALADANGGVEATVAEMNVVALGLQAYDTVVVNPSGLDEPAQLTSAYDLALIARAALERQDFRDYVLTRSAEMPGRDGTTFQIQNENRLVASYDGAIGVKNGYTTLARHTFIGAAERDGRTYLVTVMKTEGRAEDVAASLLDWAFANGLAVGSVGQLVTPEPAPEVVAADEPERTPGTPGPGPVDGGSVDSAAASVAASDGRGLGGTLAAVGLGLVAALVALRVRAVLRQRRRQASLSSATRRTETARPTAAAPSTAPATSAPRSRLGGPAEVD